MSPLKLILITVCFVNLATASQRRPAEEGVLQQAWVASDIGPYVLDESQGRARGSATLPVGMSVSVGRLLRQFEGRVRVIDYGCGNGWLVTLLWHVCRCFGERLELIGVDPYMTETESNNVEAALHVMRQSLGCEGPEVEMRRSTLLGAKLGKAQIVTMDQSFHMLTHDERAALFSDVHQVLDSKGVFVLGESLAWPDLVGAVFPLEYIYWNVSKIDSCLRRLNPVYGNLKASNDPSVRGKRTFITDYYKMLQDAQKAGFVLKAVEFPEAREGKVCEFEQGIDSALLLKIIALHHLFYDRDILLQLLAFARAKGNWEKEYQALKQKYPSGWGMKIHYIFRRSASL